MEFAEKYGVQKVHDKIEDMFTDEETDIIYITTIYNRCYGYYDKIT